MTSGGGAPIPFTRPPEWPPRKPGRFAASITVAGVEHAHVERAITLEVEGRAEAGQRRAEGARALGGAGTAAVEAHAGVVGQAEQRDRMVGRRRGPGRSGHGDAGREATGLARRPLGRARERDRRAAATATTTTTTTTDG